MMSRKSVCLALFCALTACAPVKPANDDSDGATRREISPATSAGGGITDSDTTAKENAVTTPVESGRASFYADWLQNQKTANGDVYQHTLKTAAHKTLPFGTTVKVTNIANGKHTTVVINDRGTFHGRRIIDLSKSAFTSIGDLSSGVIDVTLEVIEE